MTFKAFSLTLILALSAASSAHAEVLLMLTPGQSAQVQVDVLTKVSCLSMEQQSVCSFDHAGNDYLVKREDSTLYSYGSASDALDKLKKLRDSGLCTPSRCHINRAGNNFEVMIDTAVAYSYGSASDAIKKFQALVQEGHCEGSR